ncbi:MAG TPA: VOC family protein [Candidatus Limnocylindrales bacterium]|nr:VOC family protein [Candidatus Limnocylindrales bacterium]
MRRPHIVDWTLELIVVPVSDIDRAKAFYTDQAGFGLDVDHSAGEDFRVVQLTPPGSGCSIALMRSKEMEAGSIHGLHLIVRDIEKARAELVGRGVEVSDFFHFGGAGQAPGLDPERRNYATFATFDDPDGNTWLIQHVDRTKAEA